MNKKHMTMEEEPVVSTYMKRDVSDKWPAKIELHTSWDDWNGTSFFTTSVHDSKVYEYRGHMIKRHIQSVMFLSSPEYKLLDEHHIMVEKYRRLGYQVINEYYSPEMQDRLDRIKLENDNLEKLLKGINIPDTL